LVNHIIARYPRNDETDQEAKHMPSNNTCGASNICPKTHKTNNNPNTNPPHNTKK